MKHPSQIDTSAEGLLAVSGAEGEPLELLRGFIDQLSPGSGPRDLTGETELLGSGLLDSLSIIQLMTFLSDKFGIEIGDEDFTLENLATIGSLLDFIERKRQGMA
jgi:methoxymalonate biosynthesis acyl carrier protein